MDFNYDRNKYVFSTHINTNSYNNLPFNARSSNIGKMIISSEYPYSTQNYNFSNLYHRNIESAKLNTISNIDLNNNIQNQEILKLSYKFIESSTEDLEHPLHELVRGLRGSGWFSSRFCEFPQIIYIQFSQPVNIKQINIIIHEKNIPNQIKFFTYCPSTSDELIQNYRKANYKYVGFIKMDTNERSNYRARESRKVYINTQSLFFKIELGKNYFNKYNIFNQIGLMNLEFYGNNLKLLGNSERNNKFILRHAVQKEGSEVIGDLDDICGEELNDLKEKLNYNIKIENYAECKQIKYKLDKIRQYAKQIYDLETQKKIAVNNEDFDTAMDLKNLVDKMKINLKMIYNSNPINDISQNKNNLDVENSTLGNNNNNNVTFNDSLNNKNDNKNENKNDNTNNLNTSNENEINESIYSNQSMSRNMSMIHHQKIKSDENFMSYDDTIIPAVLKKINNEPENKEEEIGNVEKGELENISPALLKEYQLIVDVIGETGLRKLFSKQILWKEEGLNEFMEKMDEIIDNKKNEKNSDTTNQIITCIMKLSMILIEEKHPSVIIKTLDILKELFEYIKEHGTKLNIDLNITDSVLTKIKRKLGDANKKVRLKAVSLYCYMLTLDFCDYNNLIAELLEEELRHYDSKYVPKSPSLIIGKLEIFDSVFNNFDEALKSKRTTIDSFPSNLVSEYLTKNVGNNKSEVRKLARLVISKFINIFGVNKIKKKLDKIEERELAKLVNEIPVLEEYYPKFNGNIVNNNSLNNSNLSNKLSRSKTKEKSTRKNNNIFRKNTNNNNNYQNKDNNKDNNNRNIKNLKRVVSNMSNDSKNNNNNKNIRRMNSKLNSNNNSFENNKHNNSKEKKKNIPPKNKIKNKSNDFCDYCQRKMKKNEVLANHWVTDCKMFTRCEKCFMNVEVRYFNRHKLKDCKFKNEFKECKTCGEAIPKEDYEKHLKSKCSKKLGYEKCPFCHVDVADNEKGFFQHLVKEGCPAKKKNNK